MEMEIHISSHNRVLLVDLGYLMFYRYYATVKNLQFRNEYEQCSEDDILRLFQQHLMQQLIKLQKKYSVTSSNTLFCMDTPQSMVWRRDIYPEYKGTRGTAPEFIHRVKCVMLDTVREYGAVLGIDRLEADDVVFLSAQAIRNVTPGIEVFVLASDRDYLQMMRDGNMHLVDATGKEVNGVEGGADINVWIKVLMGDKSDNIPPICKGVGKKTAEKLARDGATREEFVIKKACHDALLLNERLIRFEHIPIEYQKSFQEKYTFA
jgi:5'-3' exonuclease